jgi:pimeloyl-ACP methyl ester carboxylesterase
MMPDRSDRRSDGAPGARTRRAFILVHGGFHGGWCYSRVADILRECGHRVYTPTLTGLGERCHLAHVGVTCSMHIEDILNIIKWEQLGDVILCGHSYGGVVISAVADRIASRVDALVYLDAAIPENGKSTLELLSPEEQAALQAMTEDRGGCRVLPPFPAASFNVNSADRALVDRLCTPQPFATLCERLELNGAYLNVRKKTYVRATNWGGTHPLGSYLRVKDDRSWSVIELPCGHDIMLDAPQRLAKILLELV